MHVSDSRLFERDENCLKGNHDMSVVGTKPCMYVEGWTIERHQCRTCGFLLAVHRPPGKEKKNGDRVSKNGC